MGPLPGTFDLRSSNSKSWPFSRGKNDKKKMVNSTNATNKQNVNNNNNKVVNNQKSGEATNRPPVTTVVDNDSMALPDVITDKTNTGNQQFRCSPVETPLLQTQLHRSTSSLSTSTSTGSAQTQSQGTHSIVHASVSGFVPIRHRLQEIRDMAYVVDVTWSDGRTHMVKRTFSDFYNFHFYLLDEWGAKECKDGPLRLTFYLPERGGEETEQSIETAECRELQLNKYVQELIKLPEQISACPTVLTFFESRGSDPKPYRETMGPTQLQVADQYVLCWI